VTVTKTNGDRSLLIYPRPLYLFSLSSSLVVMIINGDRSSCTNEPVRRKRKRSGEG
jgi:hypothetical protein